MRIEQIGDATLYLGDCLEILPTLGSVDAVVTSPPYDQQRRYEGNVKDWNETMRGCFGNIPASDECQILVNLGLIHRKNEVNMYWESWKEWMRSIGWRFFGLYVWDQGDGLPGNWNGRLAPSFEFVFHFNKKAIQPNKWIRTKGRIDHSKTALREKDGRVKPLSSPDKKNQPFKIPDSVIRVYREMRREYDHPAMYPQSFAEHLIQTYSIYDQTVLDPFMGSGTTGAACANLGRKFIGIEIEPKYFDIACRRIADAYKQPRLFHDEKPEPKPQELQL